MIMNLADYKNKVLGCWMGKNIGGTLGAPDEWARRKNDISFYRQELDGNPLPNDDLDIQLLWLVALEEQGVDVNSAILSEYWALYVTPHWMEYGTAKINMKRGLLPPLSGAMDNVFKNSCGAFIRSEIWACIAPGYPEVAVRYAFEDAMIDHGNGEGVYAEAFCAALESAAFVESDINKLIDIGLSYIPADSGVAGAVKCARECYQLGKTWEEAREEILKHYRGEFFAHWKEISKEDLEKGYADGTLGWDAPSNIGIVVIGLLYGEGDFGKSLCTAVNCGEDTDCTAATIGSILGIINGVGAIPEKWMQPIGRSIKTMCINLGELEDPMYSLPKRWSIPKERRFTATPGVRRLVPATIDELTDRVTRIAKQVILRNHLDIEIDQSKETDLTGLNKKLLFAGSDFAAAYEYLNGVVFSFPFFEITVDYAGDAYMKNGANKTIKLRIENKYKTPATFNFKWHAPDGFRIAPSKQGQIYVSHAFIKNPTEVEFTLSNEEIPASINRFIIEITVDGRNTEMLVPVLFLNGNTLQG
ncbi:MAG: ADP-ribosylglycohydrolase family protein [Oscillospiraceae bacterium]|nr:ADP-ribosylglycohydrolase family protein [Oscillospiraceae bacterium]